MPKSETPKKNRKQNPTNKPDTRKGKGGSFLKFILWFGPALFIGVGVIWGAYNWMPGLVGPVGEIDQAQRTQRLQISAFMAGGAIALAGFILSYFKHNEEVESNRRDQQRLDAETDRELRARYVTAVELLSDENSSIKRIAGLNALGALADDWQAKDNLDEMRVCINTITGYLRDNKYNSNAIKTPEKIKEIPDGENTTDTPADEVAVKQIGYNIIRKHFTPTGGSDTGRWDAETLDLSGAIIDYPIDLTRITIRNGTLNLAGAHITGQGGIDLTWASLGAEWAVNLSWASLGASGAVNLSGASLEAQWAVNLSWASLEARGAVNLSGATLNAKGAVNLSGATLADERAVDLFSTRLDAEWAMNLSGATLNAKGAVDLHGASLYASRTVNLNGVKFMSNETSIKIEICEFHTGASLSFNEAIDYNGKKYKMKNPVIDSIPNYGSEIDSEYVAKNGVPIK